MDTKTIVLLVLGSLIVIALIVMYVFGIRRMYGNQKSCTKHVIGTVIGPAKIEYAGHHVPLCQYMVDGQTFEVAGPLFEWGSSGSLVKQSNLTDREHLPQRLVAPRITWTLDNSEAGPGYAAWSNEDLYTVSALATLYPIGSEADIWYDPSNPQNAYVQRPVRKGLLVTIFSAGWAAVLGLCFTVLWVVL